MNLKSRSRPTTRTRRFGMVSPEVVASSLLWALVAVVAAWLTIRSSTIAYSPDSWSYVDISRALISPGRLVGDIQGTRDYANTPWVNDSFPFLWPMVLAPGVAVLGPTAPVGGLVFIPVWLLTCLVLAGTTRSLHLPGPVAPILGLALFALPDYLGEGHAGRSIPLTVLFLACSIWILLELQSRRTAVLTIALGAVLGLSAANRFDSLAYGPVFIALATALGLLSIRQCALSLVTWITFPAVWVGYSALRLDGLYVTDNRRVLLSQESVFVLDWPTADSGRSELSFATLEKMLGNATPVLHGLLISYRSWVWITVGALLIGLLATRWSRGFMAEWLARWIAGTCLSTQWPLVRFLVMLALGLTAWHFFLLSGTGYTDARYWAPLGFVLLEIMVFSAASAARGMPQSGRPYWKAVLITTTSINAAALAGLGLAVAFREYAQVDDQTELDASVTSCISDLDGVPILAGLTGFRIPATTDLRAAVAPSNAYVLTREDWEALISAYEVTHWVDTAGVGDFPLPLTAVGLLPEASCLPGG